MWHSPSICKHNRHALTRTAEDVGCKHKRQIRGGHLRRARHALLQEHLEKADDEQENPSIDDRQLFVHDTDDLFGVLRTGDALVVQRVRDERLLQLAEPELEERGGDVRVVDALEVVVPSIDSGPQLGDDVPLSGYTEYPLGLHPPERKDPIGEEGQHDGHFGSRVRPFLHLKDRIEALTKRRRVERRVARDFDLLRCGRLAPWTLFGNDAQLADAESRHYVDSPRFLRRPLAHKAAQVDFKVFRGREGDEENAEELPALEDALTVRGCVSRLDMFE